MNGYQNPGMALAVLLLAGNCTRGGEFLLLFFQHGSWSSKKHVVLANKQNSPNSMEGA